MATGCTIKSTDTTTPTTGCTGAYCDASSPDAYYADAAEAAADGGACLTDDGLAATCVGGNANCSATCQHYLTNYKRGVAREITSCVLALPTCEGAAAEIAACVTAALGKACDDPTAATYCGPIVDSCLPDGGGTTSTLNLTQCKDLAKGLSSTGRDAFTTCITDPASGYCKVDPSSCFGTIE